MAGGGKVVWSEGMFLRTQHFQQQDRYVERLIARRTSGIAAHGWGFEKLQIDRTLLEIGKFGLIDAKGVLPDGTPFEFPEDAVPPIDVQERTRDARIYLALPVHQPGGTEILNDDRSDMATRFVARDEEMVDSVSGSPLRSIVRVASLRLRFLLDGQDLSGFVLLPIAQVTEIRSNRQVVIDDSFIAPALNCEAQPVLMGYIADISGRIHQRAEAIAARIAAPGSGGMAEVAEFLMLQLLNRAQPLFGAVGADAAEQHPWVLYRALIEITGELATFTTDSRRAPELPPYRHNDLRSSFTPVLAALRDGLSRILPPSAISIPLQNRRFGVRVAVIEDTNLFKTATFYVAARSTMPLESLARQFLAQVKFAPVEQITQIVNSALPGIPLRALQVAPRQLPHVGNTLYYELDRNNAFWKQMARPGGTSGLAAHVGAALPDLELELWAING